MRKPVVPIALALVLLLAGCTPPDPVVTPVPEPSSTPLFATDADALKAATDAYAAYLKVSDEILADGGTNPDRLKAVATGDQLAADLKGFKKFAAAGEHGVGRTTFDTVTLQNFARYGNERPVVTIYLCDDVSATDITDSAGQSIVTASRPDRIPFEIGFDRVGNSLLVSSASEWSGRDFCAQ